MNEIVPRQHDVIISNLEDVCKLAEIVFKSNLYGVTSQAEAVVKIMTGMEMGFGPMAALADCPIIRGIPCPGAHLQAAAIKSSGKYDFKKLRHDKTICELEFFENGKSVGISSYTIQDAIEGGDVFASNGKGVKVGDQWWKDNWAKKPRNMLFARAMSNGKKWYAPDAAAGMLMYDQDELEAAPQLPATEAAPSSNGSQVLLPAHAAPAPPAEAQPAAPAATQETPPWLMTWEQLREIDDLRYKLGIDDDAFAAKIAANWPHHDWRKLTPDDANRVLRGLRAAHAAKDIRPVAAGAPG